MLLSFSVDYMRQMVEDGFLQAMGKDVGDARVKRQTIRRRGPVADRLIARGIPNGMELDLWWKSRTKQRAFIGSVPKWQLFPVDISNNDGQVFMRGPTGWRPIHTSLGWCPERGGSELKQEAWNDGFDSVEDFRDYFVPKSADIFPGALFRW